MADTPANENSLHARERMEDGAPQMSNDQNPDANSGANAAGQTPEQGTEQIAENDVAQGRRDTIVRLMEAIHASEKQGVPSRVVHESLLALSVSVFVGLLGREGAALLVERLPEKIRNGEFGDGIDPSADQ